MIVIEFTRSPETDWQSQDRNAPNYVRENGWRRLHAYIEDEYDTLEEMYEWIKSAVRTYSCTADTQNDYALRIVDHDSGFVYEQWPAVRGSEALMAAYTRIEWRTPTTATLSGEIKHMIQVGIRRVAGKLSLLVNAKEFHDQLDEIGCTYSGTKYNDRPSTATTVATSTHMMSTDVLLTRDYKEIEVTDRKKNEAGEISTVVTKMPVTACIDLSNVWTNPPSFEQLKKLCNSANDAARKILEHYQPIDISVEIHKKILK